MRFYQLDPIEDVRWASLVLRHRKASIFHTVGWLQALQRTYAYEPVVFTTSPPKEDLKDGFVFCRINSWITGCRLVSLPFSDHCEPLCECTEVTGTLFGFLQHQLQQQGCKYMEVRPINSNLAQIYPAAGLSTAGKYFLHILDLRPELETVFHGLDIDSVQRRVRHAEKSGLVEKCGRSIEFVNDFYTLFVLTRKRHRLPPIPFTWFENLIPSLGDALQIRIAFKGKSPISAILTLRFKDVVIYKYGCSDARFNKFGAMPWLLWRAIVEAKSHGANIFDLGRTEEGMTGLLAFKNHWVREPQPMTYWRFPDRPGSDFVGGWKLNMAKRVFSLMPDRLLRITGEMVYRHIG